MSHPGKQVSSIPARYRFSWPMRIFLGVLVFDIVFRSLVVLLPCDEWRSEFKVASYPARLPTEAEIEELSATASADNPSPVKHRVMESVDSTWDYFRPWPSAESRATFRSGEDVPKFYLCWLSTRLEFCENLLGINEDWQMFSPNVSRRRTVARTVLVFEDGSTQMIRLTADPEDLTCYAHWNQEKVLDYELKVDRDYDTRLGYCNLLSHRHPVNASGSPLERIVIFLVTYRFPRPGEDAAARLREQSGPPPAQYSPPFRGVLPEFLAVLGVDSQAGLPASVPWASLLLSGEKNREIRQSMFVYEVRTRKGRWLPK